jgi:hypothetical protein
MSPALALALLLPLGAQDPAPATPPPPTDDFQPDPGWKKLGEALWFDPEKREVILRGRVCLREGYLEHLLCLERTKEHESILATEAPPRLIHAGLILALGDPGHPVRYRPEFAAPDGPPVAIELRWEQDGKSHSADARSWVQDEKTKKPLDSGWVFAGSELFTDPDSKRVIYAADSGDLITVANFPSAILDLPLASSNSDAERGFVAFTDHIPPRNTPVTIILRKAEAPQAEAKPAP